MKGLLSVSGRSTAQPLAAPAVIPTPPRDRPSADGGGRLGNAHRERPQSAAQRAAQQAGCPQCKRSFILVLLTVGLLHHRTAGAVCFRGPVTASSRAGVPRTGSRRISRSQHRQALHQPRPWGAQFCQRVAVDHQFDESEYTSHKYCSEAWSCSSLLFAGRGAVFFRGNRGNGGLRGFWGRTKSSYASV